MGANTYCWIQDNSDLDGWPSSVPTVVFTHRDLNGHPGADIRFTSAGPVTEHAELTVAAGKRDVRVMGGGDLAGRFADAGLLDEVVVSIAPCTLGAGVPLLPRPLELARTDWTVNGEFVCIRYDLVKGRP